MGSNWKGIGGNWKESEGMGNDGGGSGRNANQPSCLEGIRRSQTETEGLGSRCKQMSGPFWDSSGQKTFAMKVI